ncbi:MAG: hypothetical protein JRH17_00805, partial [Deltaproteobacteria bacterium]|nr:hypothetical protein [Deltaproteobacteria bacterium]
MNGTVLTGLKDPPALHAAARSRAFQVFAEALAYPERELEDAIRSGMVRESLLEALAELDPKLAESADLEALCTAMG